MEAPRTCEMHTRTESKRPEPTRPPASRPLSILSQNGYGGGGCDDDDDDDGLYYANARNKTITQMRPLGERKQVGEPNLPQLRGDVAAPLQGGLPLPPPPSWRWMGGFHFLLASHHPNTLAPSAQVHLDVHLAESPFCSPSMGTSGLARRSCGRLGAVSVHHALQN